MSNNEDQIQFPAARFIKEIGRGKDGARSMSMQDAEQLYHAMLAGRVSALELGAILLSMRIKGESVDEIAGFLAAAKSFLLPLQIPADSQYAPVLIPTYNGARKKANLTPLLAMLLARRGVPVLVHGVQTDAGRVTTVEIFEAMGWPLAVDAAQVLAQMTAGRPALISIDCLSPAMAHLLSLRQILGVRNSTHTLVKILQPFDVPALRLTSYTHPEYREMLTSYFTHKVSPQEGDVFLMRGTEGETVASTGRMQQIDWLHAGECTTLEYTHQTIIGAVTETPDHIDANSTAAWIEQVLAGKIEVPHNITAQVEHCVAVARLIRHRSFAS